MPESQRHIQLVRLLTDYIACRHGRNPGLCVYSDRSESRRDEKPRSVEGFVPDVLAITVPSSFTIIGEAKTYTDLGTPHTRSQVRAFLRFLQYCANPQFILAVPPPAYAYAFGVVQVLKRDVAASNVSTEIITPGAMRFR